MIATPSPTIRDSLSRSVFLSSLAPNSRLPEPSTTGKTISRSSSRRWPARRPWTSWGRAGPGDQPVDELGAAVDDDVAVALLVHARDRGGQVAAEHGRVRPRRVAQRRGDDVLRHRVEALGELALALGPRLREALVRPPAEEHGLAAHGLVDLELRAVVAARDLEAPAAVPEILAAAGVLDHAVERYELGRDDAGHAVLLGWVRVRGEVLSSSSR